MRVSNKVAVAMYNKLGYTVYRRVLEYYSGDVDEDAFGKYHYIYLLMARSKMSPVVREPVFRVIFRTRSDTNQVVQSQNMARGLKILDSGSRGILLSV